MDRVFNKKNLFGLWIITQSSKENTLHDTGETVGKVVFHSIEKLAGRNDSDLTFYVFNCEDAVAYLEMSNPSGLLTTEN